MNNNRAVITEKTKKLNVLLACIGLVCAASVIAMIIVIAGAGSLYHNKQTFEPPEFELDAVYGIPDIPENYNYTKFKVEDGYVFYICDNIIAKEKSADIYLTSPESNKVWMQIKIYDNNDNLLCNTGIIKPGQYLKSIQLDRLPEDNNITVKVIAYQPDTYYSMGTVSLNMKIEAEEGGSHEKNNS